MFLVFSKRRVDDCQISGDLPGVDKGRLVEGSHSQNYCATNRKHRIDIDGRLPKCVGVGRAVEHSVAVQRT